MGAAAIQSASQAAMTSAQEATGNGALQAVGGAITSTIKSVGEDISNTWTGIRKAVGDKLANTPSDIASTPLAPGTNANQVVGQVTSGNADGLTDSLASIAGINMKSLFPADAIPSVDNLEASLGDFLGTIKRQVANALKSCIEKYLNYLKNKYKILDILLDFDNYIQRKIAKIRLKIQRKIRSEIEKLFNQKLKMYQIGLYRQKILGMIRKLCPKIGKKCTHSPTWIRRLQSDPTWKIVDGVTPVTTLAAAGPNTAAAIEDPNNAGQIFEAQINATMTKVIEQAQVQQSGYNNYTPDDFVGSDTTTPTVESKPGKIINTVVANIDSTITALIAKYCALGLSPDEICDRIVQILGEVHRDRICKLAHKLCNCN